MKLHLMSDGTKDGTYLATGRWNEPVANLIVTALEPDGEQRLRVQAVIHVDRVGIDIVTVLAKMKAALAQEPEPSQADAWRPSAQLATVSA